MGGWGGGRTGGRPEAGSRGEEKESTEDVGEVVEREDVVRTGGCRAKTLPHAIKQREQTLHQRLWSDRVHLFFFPFFCFLFLFFIFYF